jgi:hypothetical protein
MRYKVRTKVVVGLKISIHLGYHRKIMKSLREGRRYGEVRGFVAKGVGSLHTIGEGLGCMYVVVQVVPCIAMGLRDWADGSEGIRARCGDE